LIKRNVRRKKNNMELVAIIIALIVPIGVAIWTVRSSAKDTAKQIAALEESTTKQIESIKELARLQMDASIKQVELEIEKNLLLATQAKQEWEGIQNINSSGLSHIGEWKDSVVKQFQEQKPERDYHLYSKFINDLEAIKQRLEANKKKMD
jgi:hypothetical protein